MTEQGTPSTAEPTTDPDAHTEVHEDVPGEAESSARPAGDPDAPPGVDATAPAATEPTEADDLGDTAAAACLEPFSRAWAQLDERLGNATLEMVRRGAEKHREVMAATGLDGDPPTDWGTRSERLLEYRHGVDAGLLEPLQQGLAGGGPTAIVYEALKAAVDESVTLCSQLPEELDAPWQEGALEGAPTDTARRRLGKVIARVVSAARKAGKERPVPLRGLASRHLERAVLPAQQRVAERAFLAWAGWSRSLEQALVHWGDAALPALVAAELPADDDGSAAWTAVAAAAAELQTALERVQHQDPSEEVAKVAHAALGQARGALEADLAVAGSFLLRPDATSRAADLDHVEKRARPSLEWDESVQARIRLYQSLLGVLSGATAVQRRMVFRFRKRCLADIPQLTASAELLEALQDTLAKPGPEYAVEGRVAELDAAVASALEPATRAIPEPSLVDGVIREISDSTIDALMGMIRQVPDTLVLHSPDARVPEKGRRAETRTLPLQEVAGQSFDVLRIERIRSATRALLDALDRARTDVAELGTVYEFARDEALKELASGEPGASDRADDLVGGALRSIAEALRAQVTQLDASVVDAQKRLASEIADGSNVLLDRVGAGRMEARIFAVRSLLTDLWSWVHERLGPPLQRGRRWLVLRAMRLRRVAARLLRKGSAMVGTAPPAASSTRTLRALADTRSLTESLPLVYQRLFTLRPISDPALLAGRKDELEDAMARWKRWHDEEGIPLIIRARQGTGITSFLNVLRAEIENDGGSVAQATMVERVDDEAGLAAFLATPLGLPPTDSLDDLARAIFDAPKSALPAAVSLDNLEHLYLRVPRGTDLIERLLTLMAETEPRVFWIAGISSSAWQLVRTAEPTAASQVDVFDLSPLTASALREAIIARHRRSGLAIRYAEQTRGRGGLRHRLRRLRKAAVIQSTLEDDFFSDLQRTSGGYLTLALFQWLQAADFSSGEGVLMRPPDRPDFSVLETLTLTQNFTLKAFLEHRSLTLEEHDRIFRIPRQESYQIFESLRNRYLLEPVTNPSVDPEARSEIEEELRYRVRPLLKGAIIAHLQGRNIVH